MKVKVLQRFWNYGIHPEKKDELAEPGAVIDVAWMADLENHETAAMRGWSLDQLIEFYELRGTFIREEEPKPVTQRMAAASNKPDSQTKDEEK